MSELEGYFLPLIKMLKNTTLIQLNKILGKIVTVFKNKVPKCC